MIGTEFMEFFSFLRGSGGGDGDGAFVFRDLDSGDAHRAGCGGDDDKVAAGDAGEMDESAPRGEVLHPHRSGFHGRELFRIGCDVRDGHDRLYA